MRAFFLPLLLAAIWCGGILWYADFMPAQPAQQIETADAIVVLTGGRGRLEHGLERLLEERAPVLFVSGVHKSVSTEQLISTAGKALHDRVLPLAKDHIVLGRSATSTIENAEETTRWLREKSFGHIILITAAYHMPRSVEEFKLAMPGLKITQDPVFPDDFKRENWWEDPLSLRFVLAEFHKYLGSKLRRVLLSGT